MQLFKTQSSLFYYVNFSITSIRCLCANCIGYHNLYKDWNICFILKDSAKPFLPIWYPCEQLNQFDQRAYHLHRSFTPLFWLLWDFCDEKFVRLTLIWKINQGVIAYLFTTIVPYIRCLILLLYFARSVFSASVTDKCLGTD